MKHLNNDELEKLKTLCEFLMFNHHSELITFPRFEECISPLIQEEENEFSLKTVFSEICGENRKYLNFARLIKAYLCYKRNDSSKSIDFKNFFCHIFTHVLKSPENLIGRNMPNSQNFSSSNFKMRKGISNLKVFSTESNIIQGIMLEYDNTVKCEMLSQSNEDLILKIDLNLRVWKELDETGDIDEELIRDSITHIYGTFTSSINFLGFKCESGKMYYTGDPKHGNPFLIGQYKQKLHMMKIGLKNGGGGICYIQPSFKNHHISNSSLDLSLDQITPEYLEENDQQILDESSLNSIQTPVDKLNMIVVPLINDDCYYNHHDDDYGDVSGDSLHEILSVENLQMENKGIQENESRLTLPLHALYSTAPTNSLPINLFSSNTGDDNIDDSNLYKSKPPQKITNNRLTTSYSQLYKSEGFACNNNLITTDTHVNNWDRVSVRGLSVSSVLKNSKTLDALVEKFIDDINFELNYYHSKEKENKNKNENFYLRNQARAKDDNNAIPLNGYNSAYISALEKKFTGLIKKCTNSNANALNSMNNDKKINEFYKTRRKSLLTTPLTLKEIIARWKTWRTFLERKVNRFLICASFCVAKAIEILNNVENNFIDNNNSLETKVNVFEILTNLLQKRRYIQVFTKEDDSMVFMKQGLMERMRIKNQLIENRKVEKKLEKLEKSKQNGEIPKLIKNNTESKLEEYNSNSVNLSNSKMDKSKIKQEIEDKTNKKKAEVKKIQENKRAAAAAIPSVPIELNHDKIPEGVEIFRSQVIPNSEFTDNRFPANSKSLCPIDDSNNWILPEGILEDDLLDFEKIKWERVDNIFKSENYQVFYHDIEMDDILQGILGDCYFLSAIAALCEYPDQLKKLFLFKEKSINRCYGVYLRLNGLWEIVLVDDYFPCFGTAGTDRNNFAFTKSHGAELWVALLEKAWAKINGSYAKAIGGTPAEAFDALTNAYTMTKSIQTSELNEIWLNIVDGTANGYPMTACSRSGKNQALVESAGLVPGHAYTLLQSIEVPYQGRFEKLVKLRNPWGSGEFTGEWSDKSKIWTPELKKEINLVDSDDGSFFMKFDDFIKYYNNYGITKIHNDYNYSCLKYSKKKLLSPTVTEIELESKTKVFFQLHQKNPRFLLSNGKFGVPTSAFLILIDEEFNYVSSISNNTKNITIETELVKGKYYLLSDIAYRFIDKEQIHGYNISAYSKCKITLTESSNKYDFVKLLNSSLKDYAKKKLIAQPKGDYTVYQSKSLNSEMPFFVTAIENTSTQWRTVEFEPLDADIISISYYPDNLYARKSKLINHIKSGDFGLMLLYIFKIGKFSVPSYNVYSTPIEFVPSYSTPSDSVPCKPALLQNAVQSHPLPTVSTLCDEEFEKLVDEEGEKQKLDEDGTLILSCLQKINEVGFTIKNNNDEDLKMLLYVDNLKYKGRVETPIKFKILTNSKLFFRFELVPGEIGFEYSFNFDNDEIN